jgi:hypothetical protein
METLTIDIIDPKAKKLLEDMEDLNLISINNNNAVERLERLLGKIRSVDGPKPTLNEITQEVEIVRQQRYEQKQQGNY